MTAMLNKVFPYLFILSLLSPPSTSVKIVSKSPSMVMVRKGEPLDLFCESITPYRWCYWAHNNVEYLTTSYKDEGEIMENTVWGFQWRKSSTRCGLHIKNISLEFRGSWKCHLADTDALASAKMRQVSYLYTSHEELSFFGSNVREM